jgi:hypothetical protein
LTPHWPLLMNAGQRLPSMVEVSEYLVGSPAFKAQKSGSQ